MGPRISTFSQECGKCTILSSSHIKKEKNLKWKIKNGYHHISRNWRYTLTSAAAATTTALSVRLSGEGGGGCLVSSPDSQSMNIIRGMQSRHPYLSLSLCLSLTVIHSSQNSQKHSISSSAERTPSSHVKFLLLQGFKGSLLYLFIEQDVGLTSKNFIQGSFTHRSITSIIPHTPSTFFFSLPTALPLPSSHICNIVPHSHASRMLHYSNQPIFIFSFLYTPATYMLKMNPHFIHHFLSFINQLHTKKYHKFLLMIYHLIHYMKQSLICPWHWWQNADLYLRGVQAVTSFSTYFQDINNTTR